MVGGKGGVGLWLGGGGGEGGFGLWFRPREVLKLAH